MKIEKVNNEWVLFPEETPPTHYAIEGMTEDEIYVSPVWLMWGEGFSIRAWIQCGRNSFSAKMVAESFDSYRDDIVEADNLAATILSEWSKSHTKIYVGCDGQLAVEPSDPPTVYGVWNPKVTNIWE